MTARVKARKCKHSDQLRKNEKRVRYFYHCTLASARIAGKVSHCQKLVEETDSPPSL